EYLDRFWVDGREQQARVPAGPSAKDAVPASLAAGDPERMHALEQRVGQLLQALDEMRAFHYRFMLTCGFIFCLALISAAGYTMYRQWAAPLEPPKLNQVVPVPVQVGDKTVILGVGIASWEVPPELNAIMLQAELAERLAAAKRAAQTNSAATNLAPTNSPNAMETNKP
ncbi:MAG TPA: hypothetical protein VF988_16440, partial [Verrucomicrobiae bacterium]